METIDAFGIKVKQKQKLLNFLQSAMILLLVIHRLDSLLLQDGFNYFLKFLEEKHYRVLFQGLCTIPDWKCNSENWPDFTSLEKLFFKSTKVKADIVYVLTNMHRKVSSFKQSVPEVLFSFPVFHFVKGTWQPFKDATELVIFVSEIKGPFIYFKDITTKW